MNSMRKVSMIVWLGAVLLAGCGGSSSSLKGGGGGSGVATVTVSSSVAQIASDGSTTATITATATDSSNSPVSGQAITFTASAGTLAGTQATTNSSGQATVTLTAGTAAVGTTITVTAATGGVSGQTTVTVGAPAVKPASLTAVSSASSIPADGSASATITVFARNAANDLISGVLVTFSSNSGGVAVTQGTTDTTGSALATLTTAGDSSPRTITVTATAGGLTATVNVAVVNSSSAATSAVASLTLTSSAAYILSDGSTTATISALARDGANNVLSGVPVTFAASSGALQVTQGTTDATGTATGTLSSGGDSTTRTITVTASTSSLSSTVNVPVVAAPATPVYSMGNGTGTGFTKGSLAIGVAGIAAGGASGFTLTIVDENGNLYTAAPVTITFSSPCVASGQSEIFAAGSTTAVTSLTTTTGSLSGTYEAAGCDGKDTLIATATLAGQTISATGTFTVAPASVGSIQFVSATPTTIGLKGTGLGETSSLIFKVTDSTGAAKSGVTVSFSPDTIVGGIGLSPTTAISGSDGTVTTVISSGTVHTVVRVTASIASPALSTESSQLTISTGLPASNGFAIAVGKPSYTAQNGATLAACPNVEGFSQYFFTVPITVSLTDRYNNPVPDGTAVAFYANGGKIDGSCETGVATATYTPTPGEGSCSVTWTSQNPALTTDNPPVLTDGRATILATAVGEESFTDDNGTGFYQSPDPFINLGEPFLSANESGTYVLGDYYIDYNHNSKWDAASGSFVGITCNGTTATSTCTTSTLSLGVSHLIIQSTSAARITFLGYTGTSFNSSGQIAASASGGVLFNVQDLNCPKDANGNCESPLTETIDNTTFSIPSGNSMAQGTTITSALDSTSLGTYAQEPATFTVGCNSDRGGVTLGGTFTAGTTAGSGNIVVTVTSPSGSTTIYTIPVTVQ